MERVTLRRQWRSPPQPIDGIRPLVFYADADALHVEAVHVFEVDNGSRLASSPRSAPSMSCCRHSWRTKWGNGLTRLAAPTKLRCSRSR